MLRKAGHYPRLSDYGIVKDFETSSVVRSNKLSNDHLSFASTKACFLLLERMSEGYDSQC
jgi:hypothetical protein